MPDSRTIDTRHGLDLRAVAWAALALGGTVLVCATVAFLVWRAATPAPRLLAPNARVEVQAAGVPLEPSPRPVWAAYAAEKNRLLHAPEWIDAQAGVARIPIEGAMHALAERDAARRAAPAAARPSR